ncbi:MAG: CDP-alcohol phosphatidyltransferase family protein [Candidatus Eisenbacteria bacterium]
MPSDPMKGRVRALARPVGVALARIGVSANAVTLAGFAFAAASGLLLAHGSRIGGLVFLILGSLADLFDGAVARAHGGTGTPFGAALDSTLDRYAEALILTGILISGIERGEPALFVWLFALALTGSFLTSYVRARAEGLGMRCEVGLLERPERLVLLGIACLLGPRSDVWVLGALALGSHITFLQRLALVRREARRGSAPR